MRRKNGYTLTEILVVVLLLSIVGGIIIFNVNVVLNNNKNKSYEKYIAQVKSSAETYASLNLDAINELYEDKSFTYVTVGDLIDHGFLDEKLTNPYTGEKIPRNDLVKLSLSTETGYLSIMYPVEEEHKEVFLSSVVLSNTVGKQVDCMDGIGTYTLALSDETGKLILDKDTLLNDYKFSCKLPDGFNKTAGTMNNEVGTTDQVGTYEMTYTWTSKSGTTGTGKRYLKVVPGTITVTYNVDILEGKPADAWTPATCMGTISPTGVCTKDILIGYNYNTLSRPYRRGYILYGWFNEKQTDAENPGNGQEIKDTTKVLLKEDHTIYAHWQRKEYNVLLDSTLNDRPAVNPGTTSLTAKYNLYLDDITIPRRYYDIIFNKNDISESNGTTAATISDSNLVATWDFLGYYSTANDMYIDANGKGVKLWDIDEATTLYSKWDNGRITLPSASRPGYEFDGWYTGVNSTTKRDNNYQYEMPATLYAHWNPIVYDVNLDYNDHDGGSTFAKEPQKNITVTFDDYFSQLFNLTRTGYTFDGWYYEDTTKIETSTKATNDYKIIDNNGISLKAKWNKNQYTVTLDTNKQSAMSNNITLPGSDTYQMTFDESNNNIVQVPSVTGWTFDGWYTSDDVKVYNSDGSYNRDVLTYFDKDGEWVYTDNITLYAHWSQKKYTLTLDLNRQTNMSSTPAFSSTHSNTYEMTYDSASNNTIVKGVVTGWTFDGWFDSNNVKVFDASGKYIESTQAQYFKNGRWNYEGDLTVYAHWSQKTLHTTLNTNKPNNMSSTPSVTPNTYANVFDEDGRKKVATASATGWTFTGWYNSDNELVYDKNGNYNDSITKYINSSGKWIYDGPLELFAHWSANQYTVTFNKSNGSGGTDSILATYDSKFSTIVIPSRDGYTFDGYYTGTNGSGTKYVDNIGQCVKTWTIASDTTLYANWKANQYTITFNKQNGTGGSDNVKATYDSDIPSITIPTRDGYSFQGYYTSTGGNGTQYIKSNGTSAKKWDKASTATLYAYWTANSYTITLNKQSGSGGSDSVNATFNSAIPNISVPSRSGHVFEGYYTETNGGGEQYIKADGTSAKNWDKASNTTLYAKWTEIMPSSISLDKDELEFTIGNGTQTLTATVSPNNAYNKSVTWTSSNNDVATVSGGRVTAVRSGTATITATTTNGKKATCEVTVYDAVAKVDGVYYPTLQRALDNSNGQETTLLVDRTESVNNNGTNYINLNNHTLTGTLNNYSYLELKGNGTLHGVNAYAINNFGDNAILKIRDNLKVTATNATAIGNNGKQLYIWDNVTVEGGYNAIDCNGYTDIDSSGEINIIGGDTNHAIWVAEDWDKCSLHIAIPYNGKIYGKYNGLSIYNSNTIVYIASKTNTYVPITGGNWSVYAPYGFKKDPGMNYKVEDVLVDNPDGEGVCFDNGKGGCD